MVVGTGQASRVGTKCGCTGNCRVCGCQCAVLWLQSLAMGEYKAGSLVMGVGLEVCKYTAERASLECVHSGGSAMEI